MKGASAALALSTFGAYGLDLVNPNRPYRVALIGTGWYGKSDLFRLMQVVPVEVVALCDPDRNQLTEAGKLVAARQKSRKTPKLYGDYRLLLKENEVDIAIVGSPDHWHALQMIHACQAGKDVYVEKPVGNSIIECRTMVAAQQKYNRVVQAGQWQRSQKHFKDALDLVHSGQLGNIRTTKVWCYQGWMRPQPIVPNSAVPAGVDYTKWIGPAPMRDFNASRFHFHFRWFWDYAGGLMTDWGVHLLDYAIQGMKAGNPKSVSALGGKFAYPELAEETPDTLTTLYEFDNFNLVWDSAMGIDNGSYGRDHGIAFVGNNGTLILDRGGWEVIEERQAKNKIAVPLHKSEDNGVELHWENFIGAIRNNQPDSLHC